jgi:hypothetical protein
MNLKGHLRFYRLGRTITNDPVFKRTKSLSKAEEQKKIKRYDVINYLAERIGALNYLEIGVRNPADNFNRINIKNKYSIDPGLEFELNPVDFKMTSDEFFQQLHENKLTIPADMKFDIIFIDGLHLANQVEKDIINCFGHLEDNGFIVLHDCNPPSEYHTRESYDFLLGPAGKTWNGTTWKAFLKARTLYYSCCVNSDWGVGILSKKERPCFNLLLENKNSFFEYSLLNQNRTEQLNLLSFEDLVGCLGNKI